MSKRLKLSEPTIYDDATDSPLNILQGVKDIRNNILDFLAFDLQNYSLFQYFACDQYFERRLKVSKEDTMQIFQKHANDLHRLYSYEFLIFIFCCIRAMLGETFYRLLMSVSWTYDLSSEIADKTQFAQVHLHCTNVFELRLHPPFNGLTMFDAKSQTFITKHPNLQKNLQNIISLRVDESGHVQIGDDTFVTMDNKWKARFSKLEVFIKEGKQFNTSQLPCDVVDVIIWSKHNMCLNLDHTCSHQLKFAVISSHEHDAVCHLNCLIPGSQLQRLTVNGLNVDIKWDIWKKFPLKQNAEEIKFIQKCKGKNNMSVSQFAEHILFRNLELANGRFVLLLDEDTYTFQVQDDECHIIEFVLLNGPEIQGIVEIRTSEIPDSWTLFEVVNIKSLSIVMDYFCHGLERFRVGEAPPTRLQSRLKWQGIPHSMKEITLKNAHQVSQIELLFPFLFQPDQAIDYKPVRISINRLQQVQDLVESGKHDEKFMLLDVMFKRIKGNYDLVSDWNQHFACHFRHE